MDRDGEQLLRRQGHGADHDHPGPRPDRRCAELVGEPLDGLLLFSEMAFCTLMSGSLLGSGGRCCSVLRAGGEREAARQGFIGSLGVSPVSPAELHP